MSPGKNVTGGEKKTGKIRKTHFDIISPADVAGKTENFCEKLTKLWRVSFPDVWK